jgi:Predicted transcriptional regulator, consists of a Zn-ribbon and ATP-cone domains
MKNARECPGCGSTQSYIVDVRNKKGTTRRCRSCPVCNCRWHTLEIDEDDIKELCAASKKIGRAAVGDKIYNLFQNAIKNIN